ncbi:hypothetical protein [Streptomyces sp. NPDC059874]|uniref:hypothetical protein n=1 Tax=Streptomyces sp. NPDC059874 TaxID=3346983 RepID=UPI0036503C96
MPKKHAVRLLTAVIIAGSGLTACSQTNSDTPEAKPSSPAAAASTPAAGAQPTPSATPSVVVNGKQKPADLPAGLPLPQGELTSVTGTTGTYVLTYTTSDATSALAAYATALESAGYELDRSPSVVHAVKANVNVMVTKTPAALQVALVAE